MNESDGDGIEKLDLLERKRGTNGGEEPKVDELQHGDEATQEDDGGPRQRQVC